MNREHEAKFRILAAMAMFGTIGLFVRGISLPSSLIALVRGVVGSLFLLAVLRLRGAHLDRAAIRTNGKKLILSGACLGFNWIFLFEAYRYTTVSTATLCYYMAPILIILASPLLLKERLTVRKLCCVGAALVGMVCISGVLRTGIPSVEESRGILLGLAAAVIYAAIVLLNKGIRGIPAFDRTVVQLGVSAVTLLPYCLVTLQGQELRLDPVVAVLLSVLVLRESMGVIDVLGAVLILGAALVSELPGRKGAD